MSKATPGIFMRSRDVIQLLESVQQALGPMSHLSSPYWGGKGKPSFLPCLFILKQVCRIRKSEEKDAQKRTCKKKEKIPKQK